MDTGVGQELTCAHNTGGSLHAEKGGEQASPSASGPPELARSSADAQASPTRPEL